jgi:hypothetical protein
MITCKSGLVRVPEFVDFLLCAHDFRVLVWAFHRVHDAFEVCPRLHFENNKVVDREQKSRVFRENAKDPNIELVFLAQDPAVLNGERRPREFEELLALFIRFFPEKFSVEFIKSFCVSHCFPIV